MAIVSQIFNTTGDATGGILKTKRKYDHLGFWKVDVTPASAPMTGTIILEGQFGFGGQVENTWTTIATFTEADFGAGSGPYTTGQNVNLLPEMRMRTINNDDQGNEYLGFIME